MSGGESWLVGLGIETIGLVAAPTCPQMPPVYQVSVEGGSVRTRFVVECSSMFSGFVPPLSTYVFMYRCIDLCMHAAYTCISVYMYMCINIRTYIYTRTLTCAHKHIHAPIHAYVHMHIRTCIHSHVPTYTHIHPCTYMYIRRYRGT